MHGQEFNERSGNMCSSGKGNTLKANAPFCRPLIFHTLLQDERNLAFADKADYFLRGHYSLRS